MILRNTFFMALLGLVMASISMASIQSPYQGMELELVNTSDVGNTYRLFVNLETGARIDAVYGNSQGDLLIDNVGGDFYQNANGGPTSKEINSNFFPFVPRLEWDSYVSIGAYYQNGAPFGENNLNNIGVNWASFEGGGALTTNNGSWFLTPSDAQGNELNGQVFLGQFTIAPAFVFSLLTEHTNTHLFQLG